LISERINYRHEGDSFTGADVEDTGFFGIELEPNFVCPLCYVGHLTDGLICLSWSEFANDRSVVCIFYDGG
jgi:hypothetical protein